ncbi:hypothetical protein ABE036_18145 [Priestia aryabhattai]|uniref:hypothetical protein n=1 Tax=Priestia TaxID=2800373 RepID=UPI000D50C359|nr:hypothetical protein [Priestia megaterium]PVC65470.1 hypothetical protein C2I27_19365 [Priestia megaterium]PVE74438.1 hypothetical protein DC428_00580 [Priestia megaterium]PVE82373.1 hypothetical protein DC421_19770 [Priestia megaterium]PVE86959.1 hypothetical protein DC426_16775 [Priestia megaterium]PVE97900.1 hypothetical protein DC433_17445 [Priestia megaterium]
MKNLLYILASVIVCVIIFVVMEALFNGDWTPYVALTIFAGAIIGLLLRIQNMLTQKEKGN